MFFSMFWGREDVYAKRSKYGGYFPQCENRWNEKLCLKQCGEKILCDECENTKWIKLDVKKIIAHLLGYKEDGSDVIGIYPLLPNGMCRLIVFDFDNHEKGAEAADFANTDQEWHKEVDALRKMCEINGIKPLVERSRSRSWQKPTPGTSLPTSAYEAREVTTNSARNFGPVNLPKAKPSGEKLAVGDKVKHLTFGQGEIISATPMGNDTLLEIMFETVGSKKIMQNFARLKKLS